MKEFLDPYDPAYLEDPVDKNPYRLPNWERVKCRKVGILQSYLRAAKISYDWDDGFMLTKTPVMYMCPMTASIVMVPLSSA